MEDFNDVLHEADARKAIKEGIKLGTDTIAPTLGVKGRKIWIDKEYGYPEACDDGITILRAIKLKDPKKQLGVKILQDTSGKTNDKVGDGTTSTAVILNALVQKIIKDDTGTEALSIKRVSGDVLRLSREIKEGLKKVLDFINKHKVDIDDDKKVFNVAKVSSNSEEIGTIISELIKKLGKNAAISTGNSQGLETTCEIIEGMEFDKGLIAKAFVTETDKPRAIIENANVLVTDYKIQNVDDWKVLMAMFQGDGADLEGVNDLVIIADDVSGVPLDGLVFNKYRGMARCFAVRAPGFGQAKEYLKDIATMVGAKLVSSDEGMKFNQTNRTHLGKADKIIATLDKTTIIGGKGDKEAIESRIKQLQTKKNEEESAYEKEKLTQRISKLSGGVGIIKVGGATELEVDEKKAKIDDAINATKSALEDGIVAGGGLILYRASFELGDTEGEKILSYAIQKPFEQIVLNADIPLGDIGVPVMANENVNYGYDVEKEKFGDLMEMGIVDPANVTKTALQNAVANALLILTTSGSINLIRETSDKKKKHPLDDIDE